MKATRKGDLLILDVEGAPRFKEFVAGLGFADELGTDSYELHWFCVIGQTEDNRYVAIAEASDISLLDLAKDQVVDWKDRLLIKRIWIDQGYPHFARSLRDPWTVDGLASYASSGKGWITGKPKYIHEPEYWPQFRGYGEEHRASILVSLEDVEMGLTIMKNLIGEDRFSARTTTPRLSWVSQLKPPIELVLKHPIIKAVSHCLFNLERERLRASPVATAKPRYGNLR